MVQLIAKKGFPVDEVQLFLLMYHSEAVCFFATVGIVNNIKLWV